MKKDNPKALVSVTTGVLYVDSVDKTTAFSVSSHGIVYKVGKGIATYDNPNALPDMKQLTDNNVDKFVVTFDSFLIHRSFSKKGDVYQPYFRVSWNVTFLKSKNWAPEIALIPGTTGPVNELPKDIIQIKDFEFGKGPDGNITVPNPFFKPK